MNGTHCDNIIRFCEKHHKITSMDAIMNFGCTRLAARIKDLEGGYKGKIYVFQHHMVYRIVDGKIKKHMEYILWGYREVA